MALEGKADGKFKLLQPKLQLFIFTDANPDSLDATVKELQRIYNGIGVVVYKIMPPFNGTSMTSYRQPFPTKVTFEVPATAKDLTPYQARLEAAVNGLLETVNERRCVVWNHSGELYRRGL